MIIAMYLRLKINRNTSVSKSVSRCYSVSAFQRQMARHAKMRVQTFFPRIHRKFRSKCRLSCKWHRTASISWILSNLIIHKDELRQRTNFVCHQSRCGGSSDRRVECPPRKQADRQRSMAHGAEETHNVNIGPELRAAGVQMSLSARKHTAAATTSGASPREGL
ncbi:unnamed protein product [Trichogramma brassicae]|uniref:Uncharacterized protein n=1 Tax=Trichogramma brassicae TaxID=86971 RepID=A0A6H5ID56_9HYME|nr:unnamed protein product [Trichogramma brassicae]